MSESVSGDDKTTLNRMLLERQLLLFRRQNLNEDQQVRAAEIFGPCQTAWQSRHYPSRNSLVRYLSNVDPSGSPIGRHPDLDSSYWHSDGSWARCPPKATALYAMQVPEGEGATHFVNMYQVYDNLDRTTKARLKKLHAEHDLEMSRATRYRRMPWQWWSTEKNRESLLTRFIWWKRLIKRRWRNGTVSHPVVRTHPETGRSALFIGDHAWRITGTFWPIGIRLMREINELSFDPTATYTHNWQPGDLLIWENASILHRVGAYDHSSQVRIMRRCVILN